MDSCDGDISCISLGNGTNDNDEDDYADDSPHGDCCSKRSWPRVVVVSITIVAVAIVAWSIVAVAV